MFLAIVALDNPVLAYNLHIHVCILCCRFILCDRQDVYEDSIDMFDEEAMEEAKDRERERRNKLMEQVDFHK